MGRLFLLALCGFGAALYFPTSRAVILEKAKPVLDPLLARATVGEMETIARDLENHERTTRRLPEREPEFLAWMDQRYSLDATQDAWGSAYSLRMWPDSFGVRSPGPDARVNTNDDLQVTRTRIPRRRRR